MRRMWKALGLAGAFMALVPPVAGAGTVRVQELNPGRYFMTFDGDAGANTVRVTREGGTFTLTDTSSPTTAGVNCEAAGGGSVECQAPGDGVVELTQYLPMGGADRVEVAFTGRSDGGPMDNIINGGEGVDTLIGSRGSRDHDEMNGGAQGDVVKARGGDDELVEHGRDGPEPPASELNVLSGGGGDDFLAPGAARDNVQGGGDIDRLSYVDTDLASGDPGVRVDLAARTAEFPGEPEDKLGGVEDAIGSMGNDRLLGDGRTNWLIGAGGDDRVVGREGFDILVGDFTPLLEDALGRTGEGDDSINAKDGRADRVDCGGQQGDDASLDRADQVSGC